MTPSRHRAPPRQLAEWLVFIACTLWLAGCAQPKAGTDPNTWSGRLALQIEGQASQSFSALFELRGNDQRGGLVLSSPLGNRVAQIDWKDGHAQLVTTQETRTSDSLDALLQDAIGSHIPIAALFNWLQGAQATAPGWLADLSGIPDGRLVVHRSDPAPPATLRIVLSR